MWGESQARKAAARLLALAGVRETELKLIRLGNNATFQVGQQYVLRVARPTTPVEAVEREVQFANSLAAQDLPVVRLAELSLKQPLAAGDARGTIWENLPGGRPTYRQFGQLVRQFHELADSLDLPLPTWQPLATARQRLDTLAGQYPSDDITLLEQWYERIANELEGLESSLPTGPIHGQAEIGNARLRGSEPVFLDFERLSRGLREWDLIDSAAAVRRFGLPATDYEAFASAYGFDVMGWSGFPTLRRVWELRATTWLMQNRDHGSEIADEVAVRLDTWRTNDSRRQWRGF